HPFSPFWLLVDDVRPSAAATAPSWGAADAASEDPDVQLLDHEARNGARRDADRRQRGHLQIGHAAAPATDDVLAADEVGVVSRDAVGRPDPADETLALERVEDAVHRRGRHPRHGLSHATENRIRRRVADIFRERAVDRETLRGASQSAHATGALERG